MTNTARHVLTITTQTDRRLPLAKKSVTRYVMRCVAVIAFALLSAPGCEKPPAWEFDELDVSRAQLLNEVPLGQYAIPLPLRRDRVDVQSPLRNCLRFDFELHAVVAPEHVSRVTHNWEIYEGTVRDRVIRVCRNASLAELQEPELSTLKSRLMDALQAHLGAQEIRRLLMTEVVLLEM
jgi:hypothetical protein